MIIHSLLRGDRRIQFADYASHVRIEVHLVAFVCGMTESTATIAFQIDKLSLEENVIAQHAELLLESLKRDKSKILELIIKKCIYEANCMHFGLRILMESS